MNRLSSRGLLPALVTVLALLVALLWSARAAAEGKSIAVYIEGPDAEAVRSGVLAVVLEGEQSIKVIEPQVFADALAKQGQRGPIGPGLASARQRDKALGRLRKAADATHASAVIAGRTRKSANGLHVWLLWISPRQTELEIDEDVLQGGDREARKAALEKALGAPLEKLAPASGASTQKGSPPSEPAEASAAPPDASAAPDAPASSSAPSAADRPPRIPHQVSTALFLVGLEFAIGGRRFAYTDGLSANVRPYDVFGPPMPSVSGEIYPAAGTSIPVVRDLGLTVSYGRAFGLGSKTNDGKAVNTSWDRLLTGLRFRFRPGSAEGPVLGAHGGFGMLRFGFETSDKELKASVPDVSYLFLRGGLDARIPFSRLALLLDANYNGALSAGAVFDRFRGSTVGGIDLGVGLAVLLAGGFEARLSAQYTRYFYAFDPTPGDPYVAGGALDEFLTVGLGAVYAY